MNTTTNLAIQLGLHETATDADILGATARLQRASIERLEDNLLLRQQLEDLRELLDQSMKLSETRRMAEGRMSQHMTNMRHEKNDMEACNTKLNDEIFRLKHELAITARRCEKLQEHVLKLESELQEGNSASGQTVTGDAVPAAVHDRGWQWRPTDKNTAFAPPFGTIRQCRVCGCLVAGGPTACARCAEAGF